MYESYFGFHDRPFAAAPLVENYYPGETIEQARQTLIRIIERAEGPGLVIGPTGVGKTLLCRLISTYFEDGFDIVFLPSARIGTRKALLQSILFELHLPYRDLEEGELRLSLLDFLQPGNSSVNGMLLIVDEAQTLSLRLLDEIRMITNLVREGSPRARLILAGSMELEEHFAHPQLDSFNQRLAARCYLERLSREDATRYIQSQISMAGGDPAAVFTDDAIHAIYQATDGIPRLINQICDHALVLGCAGGRSQLQAANIDEAWSDLQQLPGSWEPDSASAQGSEKSVIEFGELDSDDLDSSDLEGVDDACADLEFADSEATAFDGTAFEEGTLEDTAFETSGWVGSDQELELDFAEVNIPTAQDSDSLSSEQKSADESVLDLVSEVIDAFEVYGTTSELDVTVSLHDRIEVADATGKADSGEVTSETDEPTDGALYQDSIILSENVTSLEPHEVISEEIAAAAELDFECLSIDCFEVKAPVAETDSVSGGTKECIMEQTSVTPNVDLADLAIDPFDESFDEEEIVIDRSTALAIEAFRGRPVVASDEGTELAGLLENEPTSAEQQLFPESEGLVDNSPSNVGETCNSDPIEEEQVLAIEVRPIEVEEFHSHVIVDEVCWEEQTQIDRSDESSLETDETAVVEHEISENSQAIDETAYDPASMFEYTIFESSADAEYALIPAGSETEFAGDDIDQEPELACVAFPDTVFAEDDRDMIQFEDELEELNEELEASPHRSPPASYQELFSQLRKA